MNLLVVGNGCVSASNEGKHYTHESIGKLLLELKDKSFNPTFVEIENETNEINNDKFCLDDNNIETNVISKKTKPSLIISLIRLFLCVLKTQHVYIFFPETLAKVVLLFCFITRTSYALYVRGERFSYSRFGKIIFKNAKYIHSTSPTMSSELSLFCSNTHTIMPMVTNPWAMLEVNDEINHGYQVVEKLNPTCNLLYVGRIEVDKGTIEIIEACEILQKRKFRYNLRLVGIGDLYRKFKDNNEEENVKFLGVINDDSTLMKEYSKSDIFIFPSHHEGFPRVLYEAMLMGVPIITTFVGGISGRMIDGFNCIQIPVNDAPALARSVEALFANKILMKKLIQNGKKTVKDVFNNHSSQSHLISKYFSK